MLQIIKSILSGVDGEASAKRAGFLWMIFVVWSFVNIVGLLFYKKLGLPETTPGTVILYDAVIMGSLVGLTVVERFITAKGGDNQKPQP